MQRDNEINISAACKDDIARLTVIDCICFPADERWSAASFESSIEAAYDIVLKAVENNTGVIVGYACISYILDQANLNKIAVDPLYRQKGLGLFILKAAENYLPDTVSEYNLEVRQSNSNAVKMYLKAGYEIIGRRRRFYRDPDEDALLMTKRKVMI